TEGRSAARVPLRQRRPGRPRALVLLPRQAHDVRGLHHAADLARGDRDRRWRVGDRLLIFWVLVAALFFQFYPLKAFNYVLPLIPALSVLAGMAVHELALAFVDWSRQPRRFGERLGLSVGRTATVLAGCAILAATASPVIASVKSDSYYGLREAAYWLKKHTAADAGVMTLSKGSAQYAISFYA